AARAAAAQVAADRAAATDDPLATSLTAQSTKPRVAITVGDPAGIGPEIATRAAADPRVLGACEPRLYGPPGSSSFPPGVLSADAGRAAYESIVAAVHDAQHGLVEAIATGPVNKQ